MAIALSTPGVDGLGEVVRRLRSWQDDAAPIQLHLGDVGWFWRFGARATAGAVRTWSRGGEVVAIGLLDGPEVLRMTMAPEAWRDEALARRVVEDVGRVLPAGRGSVEVPDGTLAGERLLEAGWALGEAWTPLRRDLAEPVEEAPGLQVVVVDPERADEYAAVHRSAFGSPKLTGERWHAMAAGPPFRDGARSLLGYDEHGAAVAEVTVWSAGPGRPGLLEPMGVRAEHRRRGHGRAICLAAAAQLRALGASCAVVCTPSANAAAIDTYISAGFARLPERRDRTRAA